MPSATLGTITRLHTTRRPVPTSAASTPEGNRLPRRVISPAWATPLSARGSSPAMAPIWTGPLAPTAVPVPTDMQCALFQKLTREEKGRVEALTHHREERAHFKTCGRFSLEYHRLRCLRPVPRQTPGEWRHLGSELITAVLHFLPKTLSDFGHQHTHVWCPDPGLHEKLLWSGLDKFGRTEVEAQANRLTTQRNLERSILKHHWILMPQHIRTNHWALLAVEVQTQKMWWLDSLFARQNSLGEAKARAEKFGEVLTATWRILRPEKRAPAWPLEIREEVAQQTNLVDCGVYMLAYCFLICVGSPLIFEPHEAHRWRSRICLVLDKGGLPVAQAAPPQWPPLPRSEAAEVAVTPRKRRRPDAAHRPRFLSKSSRVGSRLFPTGLCNTKYAG